MDPKVLPIGKDEKTNESLLQTMELGNLFRAAAEEAEVSPERALAILRNPQKRKAFVRQLRIADDQTISFHHE